VSPPTKKRRPVEGAPFKDSQATAKSPLSPDADSTAGAAFQPMPRLSVDQYCSLRDEIVLHGVLVPVVQDQHGRVIDGHNRTEIAAELGIDYPVEMMTVTDAEAEDLAVTLNCARRHLSREQTRQVIAGEIARRPDDSDRAIARRVGCSPSTVGSVRSGEVPQSHVSKLDTLDTDDVPTEAAIGEMFAQRIEAGFAEDPETWAAPHEMVKVIRVLWPWPTHPQHVALRTVAYEMFMRCSPRSPVWDLMNIWLYHVAGVALREYEDIVAGFPAGEHWPGKELAKLIRVVCNPDLDVGMQVMLRQQLEGKLALAVVDTQYWMHPDQIERCREAVGMERRQPVAGGAR